MEENWEEIDLDRINMCVMEEFNSVFLVPFSSKIVFLSSACKDDGISEEK